MTEFPFDVGDLIKIKKNNIELYNKSGPLDSDLQVLNTINKNQEILILDYIIHNDKNKWFDIKVLYKNTIGWIGIMEDETKNYFQKI